MIRRCAVFNCNTTIETTLGHRFPEDRERAHDWKVSLKLKEFPIELLQTKFIVCKDHFKSTDYHDDDDDSYLLDTAIPKLSDDTQEHTTAVLVELKEVYSSANAANDLNSIEICEPTVSTLALLHPKSMEKSRSTTSSTNNTAYSHDDICILETHESHYSINSFGGSRESCLNQSLIDAPEFTVLNVEDAEWKCTLGKIRSAASGTFEESTEVILDPGDSYRKPNHAISSTDSDVEILMSEEIADSDWSTGRSGLVELTTTEDSCGEAKDNKNAIDAEIKANVLTAECITDYDISGEDISLNSIDSLEQLTRSQLINVIKEQTAKIRHMKASLQRYRKAQQRFFQQVDSLRSQFYVDENNTFCSDNIADAAVGIAEVVQLEISHETISNDSLNYNCLHT